MESVERKEYETQKRLCGDRFERDKTDIRKNEEGLAELRQLVTEMATMQKHSMAQGNDQETRIRALESKGGVWLDRITSLGLGALIAYLATKVF